MTSQSGIPCSWRVSSHKALFRQFVHDNVRKSIYLAVFFNVHHPKFKVDKVLQQKRRPMAFVELSGDKYSLKSSQKSPKRYGNLHFPRPSNPHAEGFPLEGR